MHKHRWRCKLIVSLVLAMAALVSGCAGSAPGGAGNGIPTTPPYIVGEITAIQGGRILIESLPGQQTGDKTWLAITGTSRLFKQDGKLVPKITASELAVGQKVSAWANGPIRESYPSQGEADTVLVD